MSDPDAPVAEKTSWYRNGLKFECTQCGHCCTGAPGFVWVTIPEIYRIAEFLGMRDRDLARTHVRSVNGKFSLVERPNGDCIFYDKGCAVYPVRPAQCRTFPFWPEILTDRDSWARAALSCPGMNQGRTHSEEEIGQALKE